MTLNQFPPYIVIKSLIKTTYLALFWKVHFKKEYISRIVQMDDGQTFTVFRHISVAMKNRQPNTSPALFSVRFKFAALSHKANKWASLIPIPLIIASPGFGSKIWMLNETTGYWQGVYQWDSEAAIEAYKQSFVLGVMNKRAISDSITFETIPDTTVSQYLNRRLLSVTSSHLPTGVNQTSTLEL